MYPFLARTDSKVGMNGLGVRATSVVVESNENCIVEAKKEWVVLGQKR